MSPTEFGIIKEVFTLVNHRYYELPDGTIIRDMKEYPTHIQSTASPTPQWIHIDFSTKKGLK